MIFKIFFLIIHVGVSKGLSEWWRATFHLEGHTGWPETFSEYVYFSWVRLPQQCQRYCGIHRAYQLVSRSDTWFDALIEKGASKDYEDRFLEAVAVFEHQTVFDVEALKTVPLEKWEAGSLTELQHLCGMYPWSYTCNEIWVTLIYYYLCLLYKIIYYYLFIILYYNKIECYWVFHY